MSRQHKLLALSAFAMALAGNNYPYNPPSSSGRTYGDVRKPDSRQLREFTIKGQKVMAFSRKDAIKRLKHRKQ